MSFDEYVVKVGDQYVGAITYEDDRIYTLCGNRNSAVRWCEKIHAEARAKHFAGSRVVKLTSKKVVKCDLLDEAVKVLRESGFGCQVVVDDSGFRSIDILHWIGDR
jgi:hypothetical protein